MGSLVRWKITETGSLICLPNCDNFVNDALLNKDTVSVYA